MKKILVLTGEPSGDKHAASVVKELLCIHPNIKVYAMGSSELKAAGADIVVDIKSMSVFGLFSIFKSFRKICAANKVIKDFIANKKPDLVMFVDYPGFNLRMAEFAKKCGAKTLYFISPQIWAWAPHRIHKIKRCVDHMAVLFEFEKDLYEKAEVPVTWVGHPFVEHITDKPEETDIDILLLPGSRKLEVKLLLPLLLKSLKRIKKELPGVKVFLKPAPLLDTGLYEDCVNAGIKLSEAPILELLRRSKVAIVCSGTATLEALVASTPAVVVYKAPHLSWFLFRRLIKVDYICICNILAKELVYPEFLQDKASVENVTEYTLRMLKNQAYVSDTKEKIKRVQNMLGEKGAAKRVAELIISMMIGLLQNAHLRC